MCVDSRLHVLWYKMHAGMCSSGYTSQRGVIVLSVGLVAFHTSMACCIRLAGA